MTIPNPHESPNTRRPIHGASLWPFRILRALALLATVAGAGYGVLDGGGLLVGLLIGAWVGFAIMVMGVIPAVVLFLLDVALVRRDRPYRRPDRPQSLARWTVLGGIGGAVLGAGYGVVYLNAFATFANLESVLAYGAAGGVTIGILAGRLSAFGLNLSARAFPVDSQSAWVARGAFLWTVTVAGLGYGAHLIDGSFNKTILPTALLAILGAAVIPPLATTPPVDLSRIPPPQLPTASSLGPNDPEGGSGEEARGDWRNAPPPKFPTPNRDDQTAPGGGARGGSSAPPPRTNRSDMGSAIREETAAQAAPSSRSNPDLIERG